MKKHLVLSPLKRRQRLQNMRPGLFLFGDTLCLRTEYSCDSYIVSTGEAFWGPAPQTSESRAALLVTPVAVLLV